MSEKLYFIILIYACVENVRKLITEADGYQPHLIAHEQGYRRLIESSLITIRGPTKVHSLLKDLVHKAISETLEEVKLYTCSWIDIYGLNEKGLVEL
ncbi:hypothetical protein MKX01_021220 [Papaver californicum]|nr:hypothetical protein MKX01_021220 [Papaver californicum]